MKNLKFYEKFKILWKIQNFRKNLSFLQSSRWSNNELGSGGEEESWQSLKTLEPPEPGVQICVQHPKKVKQQVRYLGAEIYFKDFSISDAFNVSLDPELD